MNPVDIRLYGIVDPEHCLERPLSEIARISADGGVTLIQYRDKTNGIRKMILNAREISRAIAGTGAKLIINDRVDVALACGADGVHLGQSDMPVSDARRLLGEMSIIGTSIKTLDDAHNCPVDLIDYAFIGGVFPTTSKDNPAAIGVDGWLERANIIKNLQPDLPIGAIAGIREANIGELMKAGCEGVAVISALYRADDISLAARKLISAMEKHS